VVFSTAFKAADWVIRLLLPGSAYRAWRGVIHVLATVLPNFLVQQWEHCGMGEICQVLQLQVPLDLHALKVAGGGVPLDLHALKVAGGGVQVSPSGSWVAQLATIRQYLHS
jgi:dihydrodipicolinate synthase/N-acetylneuraminate lyase